MFIRLLFLLNIKGEIILNIKTLEISGFEPAFKGMRNPMDSWDRADSFRDGDNNFILGKNDLDLAKRLIKAGSEHSKFMRQIHVWCDVNMPRYVLSEWDTYKYNTKNSCSTMHKLLNNKNEITIELFLIHEDDKYIMNSIVDRLESMRKEYMETKDSKLIVRAKRLLPEGFLQLRTVSTNYAELRNMYFQRRYHKLKEEWQDTFCRWVESLPYAKELIIGE